MAFADFGQFSGSEVGARNGRERVKCGPERPVWVAGSVRRRLQEPAQVRGNRRDQAKKIPTDKGWDFAYWWRTVPTRKTVYLVASHVETRG